MLARARHTAVVFGYKNVAWTTTKPGSKVVDRSGPVGYSKTLMVAQWRGARKYTRDKLWVRIPPISKRMDVTSIKTVHLTYCLKLTQAPKRDIMSI